MTALQLNAEIYSDMSIIAKDETMLSKVAKYVRKLAKQMTDDPTRMTEEEFRQKLARSKAHADAGHYVEKRQDETMEQFLDRVCMS